MCDCDYNRSLDIATPRNVYLSGYYKRSFGYYSIKHREPVILTHLIDNLVRSKEEIANKLGPNAAEELKEIIGDISKLKYEIQTNKPLEKIPGTDLEAMAYNQCIDKCAVDCGNVTHFSCIWLLAECYMYKRIKEAFITRPSFKDYDYFLSQKKEGFDMCKPLRIQLTKHLNALTGDNDSDTKGSLLRDFTNLLKINLWGNKCDLSLSLGVVESQQAELDISIFEDNILADDCEKIFDVVYTETGTQIDIVLDNAGYELFTDLCVADYLISKKLIDIVKFHVKSYPWFISDVTKKDFDWMIKELMSSSDNLLKDLGNKWLVYKHKQVWKVEEHDFWTYPQEFVHMKTMAPDLYQMLSESRLVIFKGDLNYRKLMGEKNWDPVTPFEEALQGFNPAKLCALRTVKADLISGLKEGVAEQLAEKDSKWMETGNYGLIQFSEKIVPLENETKV
ncbi:unnamed protein product [Brassicogethes aeneus]|uniref:Sugar phosphate phosphatase n=1 Tax=Brassicogethes aeneus TaxID=1431903 RepID=A0A9P0F8N1_BRAAE|nr:unnamed protein product [Brassicogethes aeneus]